MKTQGIGRRVLVAHSGAELYGADRVLLESVRAFVADGSVVLVTVPSTGPLLAQLKIAGAEVEICQTPVLRKSALSVRGLLGLAGESVTGAWRGYRLLRRFRPDAVYVNTVTIPLWPALGRLAGAPVLVHVHEAEKTAAKPLRTALALPLLFSSSIVANSRYSADALAEALPRLRQRSTVIYNGLPGPVAPAPPGQVPGSPMRMLYLGRISQRKGVHTAIAAVAAAAKNGLEVTLEIVGAVFPGNEAYLESLHTQIREAGLVEKVTFSGFHDEVWTALAGCDVVVIPSEIDEPFGDTAVEAVLAARPVVVSRTPGLSEAVGAFASAQFFVPNDVESLVAALAVVHRDWSLFRGRAMADSVTAAAQYSPDAYGLRICQELTRLAR